MSSTPIASFVLSIIIIWITPLYATSAFITYSVDFEILDYTNINGRLLNGECCSGYKSTLGQGICRGGNTTCKPYWKICLTHYHDQSRFKNDPILNSHYRNNYFDQRETHHHQIDHQKNPAERMNAKANPRKKQSVFKSIFNRIFSSIRTVNDYTMEALSSETKTNPLPSSSSSSPSPLKPSPQASPTASPSPFSSSSSTMTNASPCSIALWSTDVISNENMKIEPIRLTATIPINSMSKKIQLDSLLSTWRTNKTEIREIFPLHQNVLVIVEIWHRNEHGDKLIARNIEQKNTTVQFPSLINQYWENGYSTKTINSSVHYKYRWRILGNVKYNELETTTEPLSVCPSGFKGEACKQPICKSECHPYHGYCEKPGECVCKFGWTGENCSVCSRMPGCVHGSCTKPFECRCEDGWSGMFCDKPSCKVGCHPQHGYCEKPGECSCRFGYQGVNCTECSTMPGCQNGGCVKSLDCNCYDGWKGLFCSIPVCAKGCDLENGWCKYPNECRCRVGWTGANCTECVPYPGCKHGTCSSTPWTCNCNQGWGGLKCDERLDWCEKNGNPCRNKGICISVTKQEGTYFCRCPKNFHGRHCDKLRAN